jgi:hypothetical protein
METKTLETKTLETTTVVRKKEEEEGINQKEGLSEHYTYLFREQFREQ